MARLVGYRSGLYSALCTVGVIIIAATSYSTRPSTPPPPPPPHPANATVGTLVIETRNGRPLSELGDSVYAKIYCRSMGPVTTGFHETSGQIATFTFAPRNMIDIEQIEVRSTTDNIGPVNSDSRIEIIQVECRHTMTGQTLRFSLR